MQEAIDFFEADCLTPEFLGRLIPQIEEELKKNEEFKKHAQDILQNRVKRLEQLYIIKSYNYK